MLTIGKASTRLKNYTSACSNIATARGTTYYSGVTLSKEFVIRESTGSLRLTKLTVIREGKVLPSANRHARYDRIRKTPEVAARSLRCLQRPPTALPSPSQAADFSWRADSV